jgi:hypothetical protein
VCSSDLFYEEVCNLLSKEFNDECIVDLGNYIKNVIIDYNYTQREFSVKHNWLDYFNNQTLVRGNFKYRVDDDSLQTTTTSRSERLLEYYKFATGNNLNPEIKIAKRIVSI